MNRTTLLIVLAAGTIAPLWSCAQSPTARPDAAARSASAIESPRRRLEALAEIEFVQPITQDLSGVARTIDPGMPRAMPSGSAEFRSATRPRAEVLAGFTIPTPASRPPRPSPEDLAAATKAYAAGRSARMANDPAMAQDLLEEAVRLDPGSATLWRELGEALLALGDRAGGADAFAAAAELGERDPRVLLVLASEGAGRNDADEVIRYSAAALADAGEPTSAESIVAGAMLGTSLLERGDLLAGAEVLSDALDRLSATSPRGGEAPELARLRARRAELDMRAGDAWMLLGQPERAARAYDRAAVPDGRTPIPVMQRRVAARTLTGRPATAALDMLDHLAAWDGDLGPEETQWLRGLSRVAGVGPALRAELLRMVNNPDARPSVRAQLLRTLVRGSNDVGEADAAMAGSGVVGRSAVIASDLLWSAPAEARIDLAARAVARDPGSARAFGSALSRLIPEPLAAARTLLASRAAHERALGAGIAAEIDQPTLASGLFEAEPAPGDDALTIAELAGRSGRWDRVGPWLDAARAVARAEPSRAPELLRTLIQCQRLEEASVMASGFDAATTRDAESLLSAAELSIAMGDAQTAIKRLDQAAIADPFEERVWERRVSLRTGDSPVADEAAARMLGRSMAERRARSALFALLRAREMGGQGLLREACEVIIGISEREPSRDLAMQLLAQAADEAGSKGDADTVAAVRAWLEARVLAAPGSVPSHLALAQMRLASDDAAGAIALLDDAWGRIGHPELARNAELILAERLDRADEAAARALARLSGVRGVDASLERAERLLLQRDTLGAVEACRSALPNGGGLTQSQSRRWQAAAFELSRLAVDTEQASGVLGLLDAALAQGLAFPDDLTRVRVLMLARTGDTERLRALLDQAALGEATGLVIVQSLLVSERAAEGLDLLAELAMAGNTVEPELVVEWARLVGSAGDAARVRVFLSMAERLGLERDAALALQDRFDFGALPGERTAARDRADIAYAGALVASFAERDAEAEGLYRLCLELDPGHAWAANDLGYALAEDDRELTEAERLTALALSILPDEASVLDSLAWARYKLGVFADELDADMVTVSREGAVTLLTRAAGLESGRYNPTIHLHLGDALWRLGRSEDAIQAWVEAERLLRDAARAVAASETPSTRAADRINAELREVRRRLSDGENGRQPPLGRVPSLDGPARAPEPAG